MLFELLIWNIFFILINVIVYSYEGRGKGIIWSGVMGLVVVLVV